jgi:hypothetical protein
VGGGGGGRGGVGSGVRVGSGGGGGRGGSFLVSCFVATLVLLIVFIVTHSAVVVAEQEIWVKYHDRKSGDMGAEGGV